MTSFGELHQQKQVSSHPTLPPGQSKLKQHSLMPMPIAACKNIYIRPSHIPYIYCVHFSIELSKQTTQTLPQGTHKIWKHLRSDFADTGDDVTADVVRVWPQSVRA